MAPKKDAAKGGHKATMVSGITTLGRAKTYKRRGLWAIKKKNKGKFPTTPQSAEKDTGAAEPKWYAPEDVSPPVAHRVIRHPTKLRAGIAPGSVVILLAGRFKGKRVVVLKQLESGLLLVTGPFKINGVPLRRVNQAYVIATSTKVDVSKVDASKISDAYFKPEKKKTAKKSEGDFFEKDEGKKELPAEYIAQQKAVDAAIQGGLDATLKAYLGARFTLKDGDRPHMMKF